MLPSEYQELCARTESDEDKALSRIQNAGIFHTGFYHPHLPTRLLHALCGLSSETGEVATLIKKWLYYGQVLDVANLKEELGDILWYVALACNACNLDMGEVMDANIRKLKSRYPDKFTEAQAADQGRDRQAERDAISFERDR